MIQIMLVDDQKSMVAGLKALLSTHEDFAVVATAGSGEEALEILDVLNAAATPNSTSDQSSLPDVVLVSMLSLRETSSQPMACS